MKFKILGGLLLLLLLQSVACSGATVAPPTTAAPATAAQPTAAPVKATTAPTAIPPTAVPATATPVPPTPAPTTAPTLAATKPTTATTQTTSATTAPTAEELTQGRFAKPEIPRITAEQLKQMMDKKDKFILIDARGQSLYLTDHIKGAISIPNEPEPPVTQMWVTDRLEWLAKDSLLVFYCD